MSDSPKDASWRWVLQAAVLASLALLVFWGLYLLDTVTAAEIVSGKLDVPGALSRYFAFDPQSQSNAVPALAGINTAVFGIVITVVSIIVQLSADRYTGVARVFLKDRVNIQVAAFYVVACVASVWLSSSVQPKFVPRTTLVAMLGITTAGLVVMMPYFGYVFWFLDPQNIVDRISRSGVSGARNGSRRRDMAKCWKAQAQTLSALEELTDIANNSIGGNDKIVASKAVDALKDFAIDYLRIKSKASAVWFTVGPEIRSNPDFVAMDPGVLTDIEHRNIWVEWKVLRQHLSIYNEALRAMRDVCYLIAIDTRYIGEAALKTKDEQLVQLVVQFLNSYLRSALNAHDQRTTYNVLNQYRLLVETMIEQGDDKAALKAARHLKYYGLVALQMGSPFVTETVAYDLAALLQFADERRAPVSNELLEEFLELDRPPYRVSSEGALAGFRKAQVKLAAHYLAGGKEPEAQHLLASLNQEPRERLQLIRRELEAIENKEFREIIDRGGDFDYLPEHQKAFLPEIFERLSGAKPA